MSVRINMAFMSKSACQVVSLFESLFCRGASVAVMLGVILPFIIAAHREPPGGPEKVH